VFLLQKIVGALLEPPGILVVGCILVLGIKRFRKYGLIFLTLLIYCLSTGLGLRLLQINSFAFVIRSLTRKPASIPCTLFPSPASYRGTSSFKKNPSPSL